MMLINLGGAEIVLVLAIAFIPLALTLYCILDIFKSQFKDQNSKLLFLIIVILAPFLGSLVYLFLRKKFVK